ncbi:MAG: AzlC family ABC transporter permease [Methyloligellaceae bacterium]
MDGSRDAQSPAWTENATRRRAYVRGLREAPSTPVFVVLGTFIGFGALARDVGLDLFQVAFVTVTVFALPGQVVLADQIGQGAVLAAAAFAVTLTAVRLLPLTVSLLPYLRSGRTTRGQELLLSHFVSITSWIEGMRRLPVLPVELRTAYFAGFATTLSCFAMAASIVGYVMAAELPPELAAGLIFLTPIYFFLSLIAGTRTAADIAAMALGTVLGPALFLVAPGFDLMLAGLIGGTLAYVGGRLWRRRR